MYESPEVFELGNVDDLTFGRPFGNVSDGIPNGLIFTPYYPESDEVEESER